MQNMVEIVIAGIAAGGAILSAYVGAKVRGEVKSPNGHTTAHMIAELYHRDQERALREQELLSKLDAHVQDAGAHFTFRPAPEPVVAGCEECASDPHAEDCSRAS